VKLEKYIKRTKDGCLLSSLFRWTCFYCSLILGRMVMFRFRNASCSAAKLCYFLLFLPSNLTLNILVTLCSTCSWETKSWQGQFSWFLSTIWTLQCTAMHFKKLYLLFQIYLMFCYYLYLLWTLLNPWALRAKRVQFCLALEKMWCGLVP